jgi:hypothetical protein
MRHALEHVRDTRNLSRLLSPVDLDDMPGLYTHVPARGMVRKFTAPVLIADPDSKYGIQLFNSQVTPDYYPLINF